MKKKTAQVTPCEEYPALASKMGLQRVFLKREDLHPYGSHKGRSLPHMIDTYVSQGVKHFAISSSGNAGLAAAMHIHALGGEEPLNMTLDIYIGQHAHPHKVERLEAYENDAIRIIQKERPLQALMRAEQDGITSLRQSTNDLALEGYATLAEEIVETLAHADGKSAQGALFIGTSSGTTAQALAQYIINKALPIQVHIVQTTSCHPMVDAFDMSDIKNEDSIADAIVDQTAYRKDTLIPLIKSTGGTGWIATNEDIRIAQELVREYAGGIDISPNGALGIVGAMHAAYTGHKIRGPVVCVVCGE